MQELGQFIGRLRRGFRPITDPAESPKIAPKKDKRTPGQVFMDRFETIKGELKELGCSTIFLGGPDYRNDKYHNVIGVEGPKVNHDKIMEFINSSGIQIPDPEDYRRSHEAAIGRLALDGLLTRQYIKKEAKLTRIILYEGDDLEWYDCRMIQIIQEGP